MGVEVSLQKQRDLFTGRFRKVKTLKSKENLEQEALFQWITLHESVYPGIGEAFHVPNGGYRRPREAEALKRRGVKAGEPDIYLLIPRRGFHGCAIELKTEHGRVSREQVFRLATLTSRGYFAVSCRGWEAARDTLVGYLALESSA